MKNAIGGAILFSMLTSAAFFSPPFIAGASACEDIYFSRDDFSHAHPLRRPVPDFTKSYKMAMAGDATEQRNVAVSYDAGYLVAACPEKAGYWYQKAARNGDLIAQQWVERNKIFQAMLAGPEFVGGASLQVALKVANAKDKYSAGKEEVLPPAEPPVSHAAETAGTTASAKLAAAETAQMQTDALHPVAAKPPVAPDAEALFVRTQNASRQDKLVSAQQLGPAPVLSSKFSPAHEPLVGSVPSTPIQPPDLKAIYSKETDVHPAQAPDAGLMPSHVSSSLLPVSGNQESVSISHAVLKSASADDVLDISLERAIDIAKQTSFRLGRSRRNIDGALSRYKAASTMYLPRFDSTLYATQSKHETPYIGPGLVPQLGANLNFGVTLPIDIGGVIGRQVSQAELARKAAEYDLVQSHLDVAYEVEINYYNALRAQEVERIDQQLVDGMERLAKEVEGAPVGVRDFIQVELANARQTLTSSRTTLDLNFDTLKQSLRLAPGVVISLTDKFSRSAVAMNGAQALREALEKRPDLGQIGVRIEQTRLSGEQVYDVRKPTLNLQLFSNNTYSSRIPGSAYDNPLVYDRGLMMTFNLPLVYFDWGYLRETQKSALLQNEQARFDLQEQRERVGLEVRQAVIALRRAEQRVNTLPDLALAHDTLRRAENDFLSDFMRAAPPTLAQMSNARASSRQAEIVTVDALYEYSLAIINLKHAVGRLDSGV